MDNTTIGGTIWNTTASSIKMGIAEGCGFDTPYGVDGWREHTLLLLCLVVLGGYHFDLYRKMKHEPSKTSLGYGNAIRKHWCRFMITHPEHAVLAVQSMRNEIMWGAFLGITCFTALTVILSSTLSHANMDCATLAMAGFDPVIRGYETSFHASTKIMMLNFLLAAVFLFSLQYLRILRHLSIYVGCSGTPIEQDVIPVAAKMYNMAAFFHWLAMRTLFAMVSFLGWLFGPSFALITTMVFVIYQFRSDNISVEPFGKYQKQCDCEIVVCKEPQPPREKGQESRKDGEGGGKAGSA